LGAALSIITWFPGTFCPHILYANHCTPCFCVTGTLHCPILLLLYACIDVNYNAWLWNHDLYIYEVIKNKCVSKTHSRHTGGSSYIYVQHRPLLSRATFPSLITCLYLLDFMMLSAFCLRWLSFLFTSLEGQGRSKREGRAREEKGKEIGKVWRGGKRECTKNSPKMQHI